MARASTRKKASSTPKESEPKSTAPRTPDIGARGRLTIEACARQLFERVEEEFPGLDCSVVQEKPRRGAFEVQLTLPGQETVEIWTGLKKGPPRKLKFPEAEVVLQAIRSHIPSQK